MTAENQHTRIVSRPRIGSNHGAISAIDRTRIAQSSSGKFAIVNLVIAIFHEAQ